jgi:hypothetical protein
MALRFVEGFEVIPAANLGYKWATVDLTTPVTYFEGRFPNSSALQMIGNEIVSFPFSDADTWTVGFAFFWSGLTSATTIFQFMEQTDDQIELRFDPSTTFFSVYRGSTLLATGAHAVPDNVWRYVEFKVFADPSVGSYILKIDSAVDLTNSVVRTTNSTNYPSTINKIRFQGVSTGLYMIDDIYLVDGSGTTNNTFLGNMKVERMYVDHQGEYSEWDSVGDPDLNLNWQFVTDYDRSRVQTAIVNAKDSYGFSKLQYVKSNIAGVSVHVVARNQDATNRSIQPLIRTNDTDYTQSAQQMTQSATLQLLQFFVEKNPDTNVAWTESDLKKTEFGIKLSS